MKAASLNSPAATHVLRCVHCGTIQQRVTPMFRCTECNELLEVSYSGLRASFSDGPLQLKDVWKQRRLSSVVTDTSGVWRFRELLPHVEPSNIVTMGGGNTPLLLLKRSAASLGLQHLHARHQGMNT